MFTTRLHNLFEDFDDFEWFCLAFPSRYRLSFKSLKVAWEINPKVCGKAYSEKLELA